MNIETIIIYPYYYSSSRLIGPQILQYYHHEVVPLVITVELRSLCAFNRRSFNFCYCLYVLTVVYSVFGVLYNIRSKRDLLTTCNKSHSCLTILITRTRSCCFGTWWWTKSSCPSATTPREAPRLIAAEAILLIGKTTTSSPRAPSNLLQACVTSRNSRRLLPTESTWSPSPAFRSPTNRSSRSAARGISRSGCGPGTVRATGQIPPPT